eukprot:GHVT01067737.1.p1 GENE.GHVT01067737.1~~GHVT01067737.1.p1  ORF type:complete len:222 (-),score=11.03 GHVT01067737.1:668-1333(-)
MVHLKIQTIRDDAAELYKNHGHYHAGDAGLDLYVVEDQTIKAGESTMIKLGIRAACFLTDDTASKNPSGTDAPVFTKNVSWLIMPRSSICKTPLRLSNSVGLIDAGYRGEIMAAVDNIKTIDYTVKRGDRIVQAVSFTGESMAFSVVDELCETTRGSGGFGSTNVRTAEAAGTIAGEVDDAAPTKKARLSVDVDLTSGLPTAKTVDTEAPAVPVESSACST